MSWTPQQLIELKAIQARLIIAIDKLTYAPNQVEAMDAKLDITAALDRLMAIKKEIKR